MSLEILIIDDEDMFREEIAEVLREQGHICRTVNNASKGLQAFAELTPDVVLCDIVMPGMGGIEVLHHICEAQKDTKIIMITAYGALDTAIQALRNGAYDYLLKPFDLYDLNQRLEKIVKEKQLINEIKSLRQKISSDSTFELVGKNKKIQKVLHLITTVSEVRSSVLIRGETGTGKELVARAIHNKSFSPGNQFVAVNCAAIPENLIEAELFGYVSGAFTGANREKKGLIEVANEGTLFLDEIGEMPLHLQAKLLRVLEERAIQRLGDTKKIPIDIRLIAATNRDLKQLIEEGGFREDLYYRIRVLEINMPPLREIRDDIPTLAQNFVTLFNKEMKRDIQGIETSALQSLMVYEWPGNIRELKNAVERAMLFQKKGLLQLENFPNEISGIKSHVPDMPDRLDLASKAYEKTHIKNVLEKTNGNRAEAARRLGIDRSTLYRKISE